MAILTNKSTCGICGRPLGMEDAVSFSPFVANRKDPLHRFSDAVFHRACLDQDADALLALNLSEAARLAGQPNVRVCRVCGETIVDPDEYFGTGLLSSNFGSRLGSFNFVHLHRRHWNGWANAGALVDEVERMVAAGEWEGPRIVVEDSEPSWSWT